LCLKNSQNPPEICENRTYEAEPTGFIKDIDTYVCPDPTKTKPVKIKQKTKSKK
jgi:hypothetical protein